MLCFRYRSPFLGLHLPFYNGFVSVTIHDKRDDFDIENVPFSVRRINYISQLIRFARACSHVDDFKSRDKYQPAKLLKQCYRYHTL